VPTVRYTIILDANLHRMAKILAGVYGTSVKDIVIKALEEYVERHREEIERVMRSLIGV